MSDDDRAGAPDDWPKPGDFKSHMQHYVESVDAELPGAWGERRRLARAMRGVIGRLMEIEAPQHELAAAAEALERYFERLDLHPRSMRYEGHHEAVAAGNPGAFFDHSPLIGQANPLAPPIVVRPAPDAEGEAEADVYFGPAYEGPPGCVHGGFVAAAFDEVLGFANSLAGRPGMTASLRVDYRKPTPLLTNLRFRARIERIEGRKHYVRGEVHAGDRLTAEAEGLFVAIDLEKLQALRAARERLEEAREE